jgi:hypothetical protein
VSDTRSESTMDTTRVHPCYKTDCATLECSITERATYPQMATYRDLSISRQQLTNVASTFHYHEISHLLHIFHELGVLLYLGFPLPPLPLCLDPSTSSIPSSFVHNAPLGWTR